MEDQKRAKGVTLVCGIPGVGDSMIVNHYNHNEYGCDLETGTIDANNWNRQVRLEAAKIGKNDLPVEANVAKCIEYTKTYEASTEKSSEFDAKWALGYFFSALENAQYRAKMKNFYDKLGDQERQTLEDNYDVHNFNQYLDNLKKTLLTAKDAKGNTITDFRPACGGDPIDRFGPFRLFVETACWNSAVRTGYLANLRQQNKGVRLSGSFGQYEEDIQMLEKLNVTKGTDPVLGVDMDKQHYGSLEHDTTKLVFVEADTSKEPIRSQIINDALENLSKFESTAAIKGPQARGRYQGIIAKSIKQQFSGADLQTKAAELKKGYADFLQVRDTQDARTAEQVLLFGCDTVDNYTILDQLEQDQQRTPLLAKNCELAKKLGFQVLQIPQAKVTEAIKQANEEAPASFEQAIANAISKQHSCRTKMDISRSIAK